MNKDTAEPWSVYSHVREEYIEVCEVMWSHRMSEAKVVEKTLHELVRKTVRKSVDDGPSRKTV